MVLCAKESYLLFNSITDQQICIIHTFYTIPYRFETWCQIEDTLLLSATNSSQEKACRNLKSLLFLTAEMLVSSIELNGKEGFFDSKENYTSRAHSAGIMQLTNEQWFCLQFETGEVVSCCPFSWILAVLLPLWHSDIEEEWQCIIISLANLVSWKIVPPCNDK